jgi:hypothetical protein
MYLNFIARLTRLGKLALITLALIMVSLGIALADTKPIPELIDDATKDASAEFRIATARTLVAAYLFIGKPLSELKAIAQQAERDRGFKELSQAIKESEENKVNIEACFILPEIKSTTVDGKNLAGLNKEDLEFQAKFGTTDNIKRTAAQILIKQVVEPVTKRQPQWYTYRIKEEDHFDGVKVQLYNWTLALDNRIGKILQEVNLPFLSQVFFAEFLITLQPSFVEGKLKCKK